MTIKLYLLLLCCRSEDMSSPPRCVSLHLRAIRWLWAAARALPAAGGLQHRQGPQRCYGKPCLQHPARLQSGAGLRHVSDSSWSNEGSWWSRDFPQTAAWTVMRNLKIHEITTRGNPVCWWSFWSFSHRPFYGYHAKEKHFMKIYLFNPQMVKR